MPAAANLLGARGRRAAARTPCRPRACCVDAGQAEMEAGRLAEADAVLGRAAALAAGAPGVGLESVARLERTRLAYLTGGGPADDEVAAQAEGAIRAFTADRDDEGLATALAPAPQRAAHRVPVRGGRARGRARSSSTRRAPGTGCW